MSDELLAIEGLEVAFGRDGARVHAVAGVDLEVHRGEAVGLVGESGCGKSTLVRTLVGLETASAGSARLDGVDLLALSRRDWRGQRRKLQLVFQDPTASLDPRMTVGALLREPLAIHGLARGSEAQQRVERMLERVGLPREAARRHPHALSGGQRQRVALARALMVEPALLLLDEPVSALDVSVQGQILNLIQQLRRELDIGLVLIAHHLAVVEQLCDRVLVMFRGRIVEEGSAQALFREPRHPYTRALLAAAPVPDPARRIAPAERLVHEAAPWGPGCAYAPRCESASERCRAERPALELDREHRTACFHPSAGIA